LQNVSGQQENTLDVRQILYKTWQIWFDVITTLHLYLETRQMVVFNNYLKKLQIFKVDVLDPDT